MGGRTAKVALAYAPSLTKPPMTVGRLPLLLLSSCGCSEEILDHVHRSYPH